MKETGADYVYPRTGIFDRCLYVKDDKPSCLVGHALALAGASVEMLIRLDKNESGSIGANAIPTYFPDLVSEDAAKVLREAQGYQDSGKTWGESVAYATGFARGFAAARGTDLEGRRYDGEYVAMAAA